MQKLLLLISFIITLLFSISNVLSDDFDKYEKEGLELECICYECSDTVNWKFFYDGNELLVNGGTNYEKVKKKKDENVFLIITSSKYNLETYVNFDERKAILWGDDLDCY